MGFIRFSGKLCTSHFQIIYPRRYQSPQIVPNGVLKEFLREIELRVGIPSLLKLSIVTMGSLIAAQASAQNVKASITFDNGVVGSPMTTVGSEPMFHHRDQVVYGAPVVSELNSAYPVNQSVRVFPSSVWDGIDVIPILNVSTSTLDFWFGDPFEDGVRTSFSIEGDGSTDLMNGSPIPNFQFRPDRFFVVGDRMIVYCSVEQANSPGALHRSGKIAILSASMLDLQDGVLNPWVVHYVSAEYSNVAHRAGGLWAISEPVFYEGAFWSVVTDYDSSLKRGGQCWILKIDPAGTPLNMVRLHIRNDVRFEHWHGGCLLFDGTSYKAIWHHGDQVKRLMFREITSLSEFATNATLDTESGIDTEFQTMVGSDQDWGPVRVAAGPDLDTALTNSQWKNAFILGQDPHDESKFLYGGDVNAGLIERGVIDSNGIAVCSTVFNPMSRNIRQEQNESSSHLSTFFVARQGMKMAGIVSNELGTDSVLVPQYTGVIESEDGGQTWGWIWKGSDTSGLSQTSGICVLTNGRVIIGSLDQASTVRGILPGGKVNGKPLFVGYRPSNILGSSSVQSVLNDGDGQVLSIGSNPEKPLPSITHSEAGFQLNRIEGVGGGAALKLTEKSLNLIDLSSSNLNAAYWTRRTTPTSQAEQMRMVIDTRFGWQVPGALVDFGAATERFTPKPKVTSDDWVRVISQYNGDHLSGDVSAGLSDLNASVRAANIGTSSGNSEVFFEYLNIGHDRPALPFKSITDSGVSSAKFETLSLGESWTILVAMEIPEECWDSWSGNEIGAWEYPAPLLTISDESGASFASIQANMTRTAMGGPDNLFNNADFAWEIIDSESGQPTQVADHPIRTSSVVVAMSKDGPSKLRYAIAGPQGIASGNRSMAALINADTLRFSNIDETDALEMYLLSIQADCRALQVEELEILVSTLSFPPQSGGGCSCPADLNSDGMLSFFDVSIFLLAFNSDDPIADFTKDQVWDFFDISAFLQAFAAGCP